MKKRRIKKRKKLIALLSAVAVLAAGGIGTGVAFAAMAAVKKASPQTPSLSPTSSAANSDFKELYFKAEGENGQKVKEVKLLLTSPSTNSSNASSLSPTSSSFGVPKGSTVSYSKKGDLIDLTHKENGVFSFEAKPGKYDLTVQGGESESGKTLSYGSYFLSPTFEIDLSSNSETLTSVSDPCGFVNAKEKEVTVGALNPSSERIEGGKASSAPFASLPGSSHPYTYQVESFLPFAQAGKNAKGKSASLTPLVFSLSLPSQTLVKGSIKVNGIPLSSLKGAALSSSSSSIAFSPLALESIEEKGKSPLPSTAPLTRGGNANREIAITFEAYLNPAPKALKSEKSSKASSPSSSAFEFEYEAWGEKNPEGKKVGLAPEVSSSSAPDGKSSPNSSDLKCSLVFKPSQGTALAEKKTPKERQIINEAATVGEMTFPTVGQDGKPLKSVTVLVDNYTGGDIYNSTNSIPYVYTDSNSNVPIGDIGIPSGTEVATSSQGDTLTFEGSEVQIFSTPYQGVTYNITPISGVNQSGQSVYYGSYYQAPTIVFSGGYTSSDDPTEDTPFMSYADPSNGFLNYTAIKLTDGGGPAGYAYTVLQQVVVGSENPSVSRVEDSSLSSSNFTSTVGSNFPYTYQAEAYLPYGNANFEQEMSAVQAYEEGGYARGAILKGSDHKSAWTPVVTDVTFSLSTPGQTVVQSSIKVNGLPLSSLQGASDSLSGSSLKVTLNPVAIADIISKGNLPLPDSGLLTQNGTTNHTLSIEWQAYLNTSFTSSASSTYNFTYAPDPIAVSLFTPEYSSSKISYSNLPLTPEVSTNGPADDSAPSSPSPSEDSSATGLWFKTLWKNGGTPATGAKFSVQNSSGQYLTPVEDNGTFEGWGYSLSPYDFEEQNKDALFSMGGLQNGTYTVTQIAPPAGALPSDAPLSFSSALSASSPEAIETVKDPQNLLDSSLDTVYYGSIPTPHLPITGGKGVLGLSLASSFLFLLGMGSWWGIRRRRSRGTSSSSKKHGF